MTRSRHPLAGVLILGLGIALGWGLASFHPQPLRASANDRSGESILLSGPIQIGYHPGLKAQIPQDALYYLDYRAGQLLAAIPAFQASGGATQYLGNFVARDLVKDFKLEAGQRPHFLMTAASLGAYSDGAAPLFVFETTTNQVALYRVQQFTVGTQSKPRLELLQLRPIAGEPMLPAVR